MVLTCVLGCAKQKECKETSDTINAAVSRIESMTFKGEDTAEMIKSVEALGRAAEEEAAKIAKLEITTLELKKRVDEYHAMLDDVAKVSKQLLEAAKQSNELEDGAKKSEKEVGAAIEAIQKECERGAAGCIEVAQKMSQAPKGSEDDKAFAAGLKKFSGELAALKPADPKVAEAVSKLVKAVDNQAKLLDKAVATEKAVDDAVKAMDKAVEPEDRIVDELNKFCGAA